MRGTAARRSSRCGTSASGPGRGAELATKKPKAYYASLLHDALYQFSIEGLPAPLDRRSEIDRIFLEILERDGFAPRKLYYWAVRIFGGGFFYLYTRRKRGYKGRKVPL